MNDNDLKQERLTLEVLSTIDSERGISQRRLASQMGVALGLTNSYIKRCVRKGFVKISEAPANRYLYCLTPKGFREKSRLTTRFLTNSLSFYRAAAESCERVYYACREDGIDAVVLCGFSDLAEIAFLKSIDGSVEVRGLYDDEFDRPEFYSREVWRDTTRMPGLARVLTRIEGAEEMLARLKTRTPEIPIYVPDVLGVGSGR
ncbi:MAG: winged helix-turn-helix transcriptional regulator [Proteobacteria bacterium]|nr:MAG: winged helix-turn-helix transcriptional regulator [Pseudomonadota bacterium]